MSGRRKSSVTVRVSGPPVNPVDEEMGYASPRRTYRVTRVTLEQAFLDGNAHEARWSGSATLVKKDGTLGEVTCTTSWHWEPDPETRRQFLATAHASIRSANEVVNKVADS